MGKFYSLKDYVHDQGLTMNEFRRLDLETQNLWRSLHQRRLKKLLKERDEWLKEIMPLVEKELEKNKKE